MKRKLKNIIKNDNVQESKILNRKKSILKIVLPLVVISLTAAAAVGISFAIKIVNKQKEKTGELNSAASYYSKIVQTSRIYK